MLTLNLSDKKHFSFDMPNIENICGYKEFNHITTVLIITIFNLIFLMLEKISIMIKIYITIFKNLGVYWAYSTCHKDFKPGKMAFLHTQK